jgi:hypothetical protein
MENPTFRVGFPTIRVVGGDGEKVLDNTILGALALSVNN